MANTYTHGYKYSLNSYSRGLIQSSKFMKISLPRIIMISQNAVLSSRNHIYLELQLLSCT
jgi:hypothetical protein